MPDWQARCTDLQLQQDMIERVRGAVSDFEYEHRLLMPDQSVNHVHLFAHVARDKNRQLEYVGAAQDCHTTESG